jgi:hypothetical protein
VLEQFKPQSISAIPRDRAAFTAYVKSENAKWSKLIADRGLKLN